MMRWMRRTRPMDDFLADIYFSERTACCVLDEIRAMVKTSNFAGLSGSVEELQRMLQSMEDALYKYKAYLGCDKAFASLRKREKELKDSIKSLQFEALKLHEGELIYLKDSPEHEAYVLGLAKGYDRAKEELKPKEEDEKEKSDDIQSD